MKKEIFYVGQGILVVSVFTPLILFLGTGFSVLSLLLQGDVWAWFGAVVLAVLGALASKHFYSRNYKQAFILSTLQFALVLASFVYLVFSLERFTSEAVKALGGSDLATQIAGGVALALKPSLGWGWILILGGPAISVFTAYAQLGSKEELKNAIKEAFSLSNIISAIAFVGVALILFVGVDRYIDMRDRAKASLALEESIKTANTLLTVNPADVPEKITLPQAPGRYADMVSKFNKAVEEYHEKLKDLSKCGGEIYEKILSFNQSSASLAYYELQMLKLEAIPCRRKRDQYYKALNKLNQTYKEVAESLRPSTTLQLQQEDDRFDRLNQILDKLQ
jgi:uncharacterized protein YukE